MSTRAAVIIASAVTAALLLAGAALTVVLTRDHDQPQQRRSCVQGSVYFECGATGSVYAPR